MPQINKQFHLELTVEQFLNACSYLELQELDLLIPSYLKKAQAEQDRQERLVHQVQSQSIEKAFDIDEDF